MKADTVDPGVKAQLIAQGGTEKVVEAVFGVTVSRLRWHRIHGGGPPYCQPGGPGGRITYLFDDVRTWLEEHKVTPTNTP